MLVIQVISFYSRTNYMARDNVVLVYAGNNMIIAMGVAFAMGFIGWVYVALLKPPSPKLCGSPNGPPLSSPRVKLSDGRHLAYKELGVRKEEARYKIIISHGLYSCKDMDLPISQVLHYRSSFTHQFLRFRTHY